MYSRTRIKKLIEQSKDNTTVVTLTDNQIEWVKDKLDLIENWKDTAVAKFTQLDNQIATLQTAGKNLANRVKTLEAKVKALEDA